MIECSACFNLYLDKKLANEAVHFIRRSISHGFLTYTIVPLCERHSTRYHKSLFVTKQDYLDWLTIKEIMEA